MRAGRWEAEPFLLPNSYNRSGSSKRGPTMSSNGILNAFPPYIQAGRLGSISFPVLITSAMFCPTSRLVSRTPHNYRRMVPISKNQLARAVAGTFLSTQDLQKVRCCYVLRRQPHQKCTCPARLPFQCIRAMADNGRFAHS